MVETGELDWFALHITLIIRFVVSTSIAEGKYALAMSGRPVRCVAKVYGKLRIVCKH